MTNKILICYSFDKISPTKRKQFHRNLFGTIEKTHHGKYQVKTKGVLTDKEYKRPIRSSIEFDEKYKKQVIKILKKYSATIHTYKVLAIE